MRSCPHCNKEIQDEAVFCRFCRRDVDPPLWLTSLQKCPYCAEWVERGIDRCPLCGKELGQATPFSIPAEEVEETSDIFSRLRRSAESLEEPEEESEEVEPFQDEVFEEHPEPEPLDVTGERTSGWFDRLRKPTETTPTEPDEGLAVLHERRIDLQDEFTSTDEEEPASEPGKEPIGPRLAEVGGNVLRWVLIAITAVVIVVVAVLGYQRFTAAGTLPARATDTAQATSQPEQPTEAPASPAPTIHPGTPGVLLPTLPGTTRECVSWETITLQMAGETVCAFGDIKRWFEVTDIPYVAIFSEEPGTFAFIDREQTYPEFRPGTCVTASGTIEIMRSTRPFIDVEGNLQECGPDINPSGSAATNTP
jgi:hypothetical protein